MKGIVFTSLADMVEEHYGLKSWQAMLDACPLATGGSYSSGGIYPDKEILCLVGQLQQRLDVPLDILLRTFGEYLFDCLTKMHVNYLTSKATPRDFIMSIDDEIHRDIEKLYPGTSFPFLEYTNYTDDGLSIIYRSPRKLCFLAEGLIQGVANQYKTDIGIIHSKCMHRGDKYCQLDLTFHE